jgi:hypothetical protein
MVKLRTLEEELAEVLGLAQAARKATSATTPTAPTGSSS